ncbi:MAG: transglutaminase-like domain-containing protein [Verrucomicrobiota bacterium]|nr:transglutaminase-like domain-containing protein [Verrucomicrobiota bacterium]
MEGLEQQAALLRLLGDDDPATVALVKNQLAARGPTLLPQLRELLAGAEPAAAVPLREVVGELEGRVADARFAAMCAGFGDDGPLEEAAWSLAATFFPGEDFARQRETLDGWGREAAVRLASRRTGEKRAAALATLLGGDLQLRGNEQDYYSINNSLLPRVIDTRLGIPISLSLVYLLVGARAGLSIAGVGLPGHFLVRHEDIVLDPFHGGRRVSLEECTVLLERQDLTLQPHHLIPVNARAILLRMLTNLHHLAGETDPPLAGKIGGWMDALHGFAA